MWRRWQRVAGWAAVVSALAWSVKFIILSGTDGQPGTATFLTAGVLPTVGSVAGLVAALGVAAPLVERRHWAVRVVLTLLLGAGVVVLASTSTAWVSGWSAVTSSADVVVRTESSVLASAAVMAVIALWLLRPGMRGRVSTYGLLLAGVLWVTKATARSLGATLEGWTVAAYQAGLFLFVLALAVVAVGVVRSRDHARLRGPVALVALFVALSSLPGPGDELAVGVIGAAAVAMGATRLRAMEPAAGGA